LNSFILSSPEGSKFKNKIAVVGKGSYTLNNCIVFSDIKYDEKYGLKFFKKWLGMIFKIISSQYAVWKDFNEQIENQFQARLTYTSGHFSTGSPTLSSLSEVNLTGEKILTLFDRVKKLYYLNFEYANPRSMNYKKYILSEDASLPLAFLKNPGPKNRTREFDSVNLSFYRTLLQESKSLPTGNVATYSSIRTELDLLKFLEQSKQLFNLLCFIHSLDLIDDNFSEQEYSDEIKEYIFELFKLGFALRPNTKSPKILEIYPLYDFSPGQATSRDCIGFLEKNYKKWFVYIDFFEDIEDEVLAGKLSLIASNNVIDKVRWIRAEIKEEEDLQLITNTQLEQAKHYNKNRLAIWPKFLQRQMIIAHGQTDSGFFSLLKCIMDGKAQYSDIKSEFEILGLQDELDRTLKQNNLFVDYAGYEQPLEVVGEGDDCVIGIKPFLRNTIDKLYQEDSNFNYMEPGNGLNRIFARRLIKETSFPWRAPHNVGLTEFGALHIELKRKMFFTFITNSKNKNIKIYTLFKNTSAENNESIFDSYSNLKKSFPDIQYAVQGNQNQNYIVTINIDYQDFDLEISTISSKIMSFFENFIKDSDIHLK